MLVDPAIVPANEEGRLAALRRYDILDTPPDGAFDNVTKLAARLFKVPIAIVSLVDSDRIWFKSHHGVDATQIDREPGLCASGILGNMPYVLSNASTDPRSMTNPLVAGAMGLRFYAGVPLRTHDNYNLGMLCCLDQQPREVTPEEMNDLQCLAQMVMDQMEVRLAARKIDQLGQQVAQARERLQLAVRAGRVGVWGLDLALGRFDWDEQMHVLYGCQSGSFETTPQAWLALIHPEDRERVQASWQASVSGKAAFESEFRVLLAHGEVRYLRSLAQVYKNEQGQPTRLLGTNWDVTEERRASEALLEAKNAAEAAERAKSSFLASMSHELRTPLNAIIGFAEIMRHDPALSADNAHYVGIINQSGNHLLALINEVLDMAKVESGRVELLEHDIDLPSFLDTVAAMITVRAEKKDLRLVREFAPELPRFVRTDELKLRQVLLNLLSNAVKFTQHGEVRLRVRYAPLAEAGQGELHCEISDTGPGMGAEELAGLFTPFQQGHAGRSSQEGTGLGLVLSKRFVELMGGSISVRSQLGAGSSFAFSVRLGLAAGGQAADPLRRVSGLAPGQRKIKVLVVDDILLNRLLLERMMAAVGFEVCSAVNGEEAVQMFERYKPDFIWIDLVMPVMNGDAAARRIRALPGGQQVRIVCVTASALLEDRSRILASGCDEVLFKPLREPQIFGLMQDLLGLEFVYDDAGSETLAQSLSQLPDLQSGQAALPALPEDWLQPFQAAVLSGDTQLIQAQIQTLSASHADLGLRLQALLDDLQLDRLAVFAETQAQLQTPSAA